MPDPIIVRCSKCQQRMKVTPLATESQVKCVGCGAVLRIAAAKGSTGQTLGGQASGGQGLGGQSVAPATVPATPTSHFAPSPAPQPRPHAAAASAPKAAKKGIPKWVFLVVGTLVLLPLVCCGGIGLIVSMRVNSGKPVPIAVSLRAAVPPHQFPQLGTPEKTYPSGVKRYFVRVQSHPTLPGHQMQMQVFVPAGEHAAHSLPCVLVAPAGTPMIHGAGLQEHEEYDAETLPYANAGFVVVHYSLDGAIPEGTDDESMPGIIGKAYPAFKASGAGVVNGRNAVEFVTKNLAMVDPQQINCAGHSSAGSLSLLLAAHEPRIHRCVAYAAAYDLEARMGDMASNFAMRTLMPGIKEFITETSPMNHIDTIGCPVLIFHARDDSNVPFSDAETFVARMKAANKDVTFETTPTGDHYDSMIDPGIPTAIEWLKK